MSSPVRHFLWRHDKRQKKPGFCEKTGFLAEGAHSGELLDPSVVGLASFKHTSNLVSGSCLIPCQTWEMHSSPGVLAIKFTRKLQRSQGIP
ncbi:MAG TPA: hypothetical protein DCY88_07585 [Cyanobacteria bacterium UBA11372]|nr:hypothetical protein [Cyanobacteria bacterium UBA11372]